MIRLLVLLVASSSLVWAKQSCFSCTNARDEVTVNSWNWGPPLSGKPTGMIFGNDNCNLSPWEVGGTVDCDSLCFKWQFNYTNTQTRGAAYETIRGCSDQVSGLGSPSQETCQVIQQPQGGTNNPGGGPSGQYFKCFCTGNLCNPASKMTVLSLGASLFIALSIIFYQN